MPAPAAAPAAAAAAAAATCALSEPDQELLPIPQRRSSAAGCGRQGRPLLLCCAFLKGPAPARGSARARGRRLCSGALRAAASGAQRRRHRDTLSCMPGEQERSPPQLCAHGFQLWRVLPFRGAPRKAGAVPAGPRAAGAGSRLRQAPPRGALASLLLRDFHCGTLSPNHGG